MHRAFARGRGGYQALPDDLTDTEDGSGVQVRSPPEEMVAAAEPAQRECSIPDPDGDDFNIAVGLVIVINAAVLGLETDLGSDRFILFEHFFAVFFTGEMFIRFYSHGVVQYFARGSNAFDFLLVCTGDFDLWVSPFLVRGHGGAGAHSGNQSAKLMKLLRMFRVMRIVRLFKMFHQLQIILEAFMKALHTVMWVGLLTLILNYVCAVFLTQTVGHNAAMWGEKEDLILQWFGTIGNSLRTLFIVITLAQWDEIALTLSEKINGLVVFSLAMAYITVTAFTMVSLITGIISEELVGAQKEDEITKMEMIEKGRQDLFSKFTEILERLDADGSGTLAPDEISSAFEDENLKLMTRLESLNIHMEKKDFLEMLKRLQDAKGEEEVSIEDVANALKSLCGTASSSSVWDLKMLTTQVHNQTLTNEKKMADEQLRFAELLKENQGKTSEGLEQLRSRLDRVEAQVQRNSEQMNKKLDALMSGMSKLCDLHSEFVKQPHNGSQAVQQSQVGASVWPPNEINSPIFSRRTQSSRLPTSPAALGSSLSDSVPHVPQAQPAVDSSAKLLPSELWSVSSLTSDAVISEALVSAFQVSDPGSMPSAAGPLR
eukprot:TRINITY_DN63415_c0_g1_i1.p1 TRINITY_DN63415_c0_g1~~TRINITY_DN63415_c0_g1_i1.p1  ORF type:complete len:601 (-),score=129.60 TRINITY_DN63415_c0_g1_i1:28-1830(-)